LAVNGWMSATRSRGSNDCAHESRVSIPDRLQVGDERPGFIDTTKLEEHADHSRERKFVRRKNSTLAHASRAEGANEAVMRDEEVGGNLNSHAAARFY
jgi:hypothetical protein